MIRPLKISDADFSWRWRNDPEIWKLTGRTWQRFVTREMEKNWISKVIKNTNERRFAICVGDNEQYVGNVQLTDIENEKAQFHIFVGDKSKWGKGIGTQATKLLLEYAFAKLKLQTVYLIVNMKNQAAIRSYQKSGFRILEESDGKYKMIIEKNVTLAD